MASGLTAYAFQLSFIQGLSQELSDGGRAVFYAQLQAAAAGSSHQGQGGFVDVVDAALAVPKIMPESKAKRSSMVCSRLKI